MLLYFRARERRARGERSRFEDLVGEIKDSLASRPEPSEYAVNAALQLCTGLEFGSPQNAGQSRVRVRRVGPLLAKSANKRTASIGVKMEGAARRLNLLGQPMEITGTPLKGRRQVRLGPTAARSCWWTFGPPGAGRAVAELPNVKKNYELYHDKGFDVVGISLDYQKDRLEKFIEEARDSLDHAVRQRERR